MCSCRACHGCCPDVCRVYKEPDRSERMASSLRSQTRIFRSRLEHFTMVDRQTTTKHLVLCHHLTLTHQRLLDHVIITTDAAMCVSTFIRLIIETWFEICISHRNTSSSSMHYRPYGAMRGCYFPLQQSFSLILFFFNLLPVHGEIVRASSHR